MNMKSVCTLVVSSALVAGCLAVGCGGDDAASKESATSAEPSKAPTDNAGEDKSDKTAASDRADKSDRSDKSDKPKRTRDKSSKASGDDAKSGDVPASSGDKFGIAACDDYVKTVYDCGNKSQIDVAEKMVIKKWREALADGKSASDVEPMCTKAAGLFKCLKK